MHYPFLFVYGTLRPGCDGPEAQWLMSVAHHAGPAAARGRLYRAGDYPGFVPGPDGVVAGDLFLLPDDPAVLNRIDEYEECAAHFPQPWEYRRERLTVHAGDGPVQAWAYVYARDVSALQWIESGDFLR
ncbi:MULTISPECIES: gamma-glutamylcyclotransferase family protein [Sphingobium]|nr:MULTISPECIES: gamma-glutamylcyclotransferase family protein [Sphingobium]